MFKNALLKNIWCIIIVNFSIEVFLSGGLKTTKFLGHNVYVRRERQPNLLLPNNIR